MQHTLQFEGVRPAVMSGWLYLPYEALGGREALPRIKKSLTFRPRFQDPDEPKVIDLYHDWVERDYLGVPREWGIERFKGTLPLIDKTSMGREISVPRLPDPNHPRVRDPEQQRRFITDIGNEFQTRRSFIAQAGTGTGKTVASLSVAGGTLKRSTIIFVHLERLMEQWMEEIHDKLGVPVDRIGRIQSDVCEYENKDFVVAMLHSVVRRRYPKAVYSAFGLSIFDEVHKLGTGFFAPAVYQFNSHYRLGLSATVERDDGAERVFFAHLGKIEVVSTAPAMPMDVYPLRFRSSKPLWGNNVNSRVKCLSEDNERNMWLASLIKRAHVAGRQGLFVSFSVEHLQRLMYLAEQMGVPKESMGQFTGQTHSGRYCPIEKVVTGEGETDFCYVPQRDARNHVVVTTKKKDISSEELKRVKTTCQHTFATYGMIVEGIDEPRWDFGIDLTPRGKATQLIGRIRRVFPDKPRPAWLTPYDENCVFSRRMYNKRCKDYLDSGATIKDMA